MATSIGQYAPVFLLGETPWQRSLESHSLQSCKELDMIEQACVHRHAFFFFLFCCTSASVRAEHEGGVTALVVGTWRLQVCRGMGCLSHRSYGPIRIFFQVSSSLQSEDPFGCSFSVATPIEALRGLPFLGSFSDLWCVSHIEGCFQLGSYSVGLFIKQLKGHPVWGPTLKFNESGAWWASLSIVQLPMLACGERLWSWLHPYMWLSSISWFPCLPGFPSQAFPTTISSLAFPFSVCPVNSNLCPEIAPQSLHFSSQLLHLLGHLSLSRVHMAAYCLNLIPFRLPQISCFTLTLICFSSDSDNCPDMGIGFQLQFQQPLRAGPDLLTFMFPPLVPSFY